MATTKFAGKKNPFTGERIGAVDPKTLVICDDHVPVGRARQVSKYDAKFRELKPGQCIKCEPGDAGKINHALRKWLDQRGLEHVKTKAMMHHPSDNMGRVWRLA